MPSEQFYTSNNQASIDNNKLDNFFSQWYTIVEMPRDIDKIGIDRIWIDKDTGIRYSVEYKSDRTAANTNNAFVETISVDRDNKPGWAYTCSAQFIAYYVPPLNKVWLMSTIAIKNQVDEWKKMYPIKSCPNKDKSGNGYTTYGVTVPLTIFTNTGLWEAWDIPS